MMPERLNRCLRSSSRSWRCMAAGKRGNCTFSSYKAIGQKWRASSRCKAWRRRGKRPLPADAPSCDCGRKRRKAMRGRMGRVSSAPAARPVACLPSVKRRLLLSMSSGTMRCEGSGRVGRLPSAPAGRRVHRLRLVGASIGSGWSSVGWSARPSAPAGRASAGASIGSGCHRLRPVELFTGSGRSSYSPGSGGWGRRQFRVSFCSRCHRIG